MTKLSAGFAALVEHDGTVPIVPIAPDSYGYFLAAPAPLGTVAIAACEPPHHVG